MIQWICGVKFEQKIQTSTLLKRFKVINIEDDIHLNRPRFSGHLHIIDDDVWPKKVTNVHITGTLRKDGPKFRLREVIN